MSDTYQYTEWTDGAVTLKAGDIIRSKVTGKPWAFMDTLILGFTASNGNIAMALLARPYVYASSVGTTGPTVLTGVEQYTAYCGSIASHDDIIATGRVL